MSVVSLFDNKPTPLRRRGGSECKSCEDQPVGKHHRKRLHRAEMPTQQLDRAYAEIIQEVRVAQTGVQYLLAFVLTLAFTPRFADLSPGQLRLYIVTLVLGAAATALLMAPAAFHRVVYRQRLRRHLVMAANRFAIAGLVVLVAANGCAIMLILQFVIGPSALVGVLTSAVLAWFVLMWLAIPLWCRYRHRHREPAMDQATRRGAEAPLESAAA
jgi:Family of unknown function (DUF6328)